MLIFWVFVQYLSGSNCKNETSVEWEFVFFVADRELAEKFPSPETYNLLGDAYMNIQEVCKNIHFSLVSSKSWLFLVSCARLMQSAIGEQSFLVIFLFCQNWFLFGKRHKHVMFIAGQSSWSVRVGFEEEPTRCSTGQQDGTGAGKNSSVPQGLWCSLQF